MTSDSNEPIIDTGGGAFLNKGSVVQTGGGDFVGRDQNLIQVYMSQDVEAGELYEGLFGGSSQPYFPDRPFSANDASIFVGRDNEIEAIIAHTKDNQRQAVLLSGPADVGKTSLLFAGVIPRLKKEGVLISHLKNYTNATHLLHLALSTQAKQLNVDVQDEVSLANLVQAIATNTSRGQLVILDQFERYFLPEVKATERITLKENIQQVLELVDSQFFNLIFSIREDMIPELIKSWGELLPSLTQPPISLSPLTTKKAAEAINGPFKNISPDKPPYRLVHYDKEVEKQLLEDLDNLSENQKDFVLPADLQIVCYRLYEAAQGTYPYEISTELYFEISANKGAEYILDTHFENLMSRVPQAQQSLAHNIATAMLDTELNFWVTATDLFLKNATPTQIEETMEEMVKAGLLIWHISESGRAFAFASNSIKDAAYRAAGPDALKRQQARNELNYAWRSWIAYNETVTPRQLRYIEKYSTDQSFTPERTLLLLRSAITHNLPTAFWLTYLKQDDARRFIRLIESDTGEVETANEDTWLTRRNQMRLLLGMLDKEHQLPTKPSSNDFGLITWTAVSHPADNSICRETAVLTLLAAYGADTLKRIKAASKAEQLSAARLAELRGILADTDPDLEKEIQNQSLSKKEQFRIWWWRFRRRFLIDIRFISMITLGGGIGMGLGLAILRALLAILINEEAGFYFYGSFPVGFLLGAGLTVGLLLVNKVRLQSPLLFIPDLTKQTRPKFLATMLGAACFTLAHIVQSIVLNARAFIHTPLIPIMAFLAGLGLSQAVYDQPFKGWHLGPWRWFSRLFIAALTMGLSQAVFALLPDYGANFIFGWSGFFYESRLRETVIHLGFENIVDTTEWFHWVGLVDAALTGIAMALGLTIGLIMALKSYEQWRRREFNDGSSEETL